MILLTIDEVKTFLNNHIVIHQHLSQLIDRCIAEKKPLFAPDEIDDLTDLVDNGLLNKSSAERYEFNYESLVVCYVLMNKAEQIMAESMPVELIPALEYGDRFYLEIRNPSPRTHWYFSLSIKFDRFILIYLNQVHKIDVTAFYDRVTEEMLDASIPIRHYGNSYSSAFPYLNDDVPQAFTAIKKMAADNEKKSYTQNALNDISKFNPIKAKALYEYGKQNNSQEISGFVSILQAQLYVIDPLYFFQEAVTLFSTQPNEGLLSLTWMPFRRDTDIKSAFELISAKAIVNDDYLMNLPAFYCRIIENELTETDVRMNCFQKISDLLSLDNKSLHYNLIHRVGLIDGYDDLKYSLLPQVIGLDPHYIKIFFNRFKDVNYLFDLLSSTYFELGPAVDFSLFSDSFRDLQHSNPNDFEKKLLQLLVDDYARVRLAGLMVLRSKYSGIYNVDFLKLDEKGQSRIIKTLLPHPHTIEDILPLIIKLRKSKFELVKELLKQQLLELIWAYDYHLLTLINSLMEDGNAGDKLLISELETAFNEYDTVKQQKLSVLELDPLQNQLEEYEYYYRTEHEVRAEQMEKATKQSFFTQMAKNVSVIRGNAFKVTGSNQITRLGAVSTSMLIDMRYYHNPDQYQWEYNQEMTGHDYLPVEITE